MLPAPFRSMCLRAVQLDLLAMEPAAERQRRRGLAQPVGCQKFARPVSCSDGPGSPYGIMIIRVPAPALSHLRQGLRLASPARPVIGIQGRRAARAAA